LKIPLGVLWGLTLFGASTYCSWRKMLTAGGSLILHRESGIFRYRGFAGFPITGRIPAGLQDKKYG
jgi:hypothetical protein